MNEDSRRPGRIAAAVTAASIACAAGGTWLELAARSAGRPVPSTGRSDLVLAILFPIAGTVVLRRHPRNRTGWVLLSGALVGVSLLAHQWAYDAAVARPGVLPLGSLATWLSAWTYWPYWLQPTLLPVLFPHGRAPSPRWRAFVKAVLVVAGVGVLATMLKVDEDVEGLGLDNPLGVELFGPVPIFMQIGTVGLLGLVATPMAIVGLARRQSRAAGVERSRLQWLLLGFTSFFILGLTSAVVPVGDNLLFSIACAAIPASIAVAVLRHGMLEIEVAVNRTIVYALLTSVSLLGYVGLVAVVSRYASASRSGVAPVAAALVVALAASGRSRVQRLVDRRLFGARRDPMSLVEQVASSTSAAAEPLQALSDTVATALRLPFVQVLDAEGHPLARAGEPVAGTHVFPVVDRGRSLGVLVVGRRSRNERLRPEEQAALQEVARRVATLQHTAALAADLQRSYGRTVAAREEERKRLRRDLHDGLGPELAGMALQLDSLAGRLDGDPDLAARAGVLRDRLRETVGEVRRIVDGLRPAAVDRLGLADALRALASSPGVTADEVTVRITVHVDLPDPSSIPAAVEVAAYRIAAEALTNAIRHADAREAVLRATAGHDGLRIEVRDDGRGFGADATAGVGLQSLHDRAAEVGGELQVDSAPGRGTVVAAILPLTPAANRVRS